MQSLLGRAVLALSMMIGFYALALGIAGGLVAIPLFEWTHSDRVHVRLALSCLAGAGIIVWSVIPRVDRFKAPGTRLTPGEQPRLFTLIREVAEATRQEMPRHVFLVSDVNAFVTSRGGWMGFGAERVMGIGLPLLQALTIPQLRAVLAHEFGHFYGGDTRLGPWIYKTRAAISRTVANLRGAQGWLHKPFEWYGRAFLRVSHAVSRQQEYAADRLAAKVASPAALGGGLVAVERAALAYASYWDDELAPTLNAGYLPPIAQGFAQFMAVPSIAELLREATDSALQEGKSDPYDTHPALRERIAAVGWAPSLEPPQDLEPAVDLLDDLPSLERGVVASLTSNAEARTLDSIDWMDVPRRVLLPGWRERVGSAGAFLAGLRPRVLPRIVTPLSDEVGVLDGLAGRELTSDQRIGYASLLVGSALSLVLCERGWALSAPPGEKVTLMRGSERIEPFAIVEDLASGRLDEASWQARTRGWGIEDLDLGGELGLSVEYVEVPMPAQSDAAGRPSAAIRTSFTWVWGVPIGILVVAFSAWFTYIERFKMLDQSLAFIWGLTGGLLFAWLYGLRFVGLSTQRRLGLRNRISVFQMLCLYTLAPFFLIGALYGFANAIGDPSPLQTSHAIVTSTNVSRSETAWFARVLHRGKRVEVKITREQHAKLRLGSSELILETHAGNLGQEWLSGYQVLP